MNEFYVYQLIDSRNGQPFYVGKGKGNRMYKHQHAALSVTGIPSNRHLERKIRSIIDDLGRVEYAKIADELLEVDALVLEKDIIAQIGIKNLCNKTDGGIGGDCLTNNPRYDEICKRMGDSRRGKKRPKHVVEAIQKKHAEWRQSSEGQKYYQELSFERCGDGNPMFGRKEDAEKTRQRMQNLHATPKWNTGKTKHDDPRLAKLGVWKGKIPPNATPAKFQNIDTGEIVEGRTLKEAYIRAGLSSKAAHQLKTGIKQQHNGWLYLHERKHS